MTVTTGATRELVERLSAEHPEFRYEINTHGLVEMDVTPARNQHGRYVLALGAWLMARYGDERVSTETGIATSRRDPEPYRQVDLALFHAASDPRARYNDPHDIALVIEVLSDSTAEVDRGAKFYEFEAVGILNYWIADPEAQTVDMWRLTPTGYTRLERAPLPWSQLRAGDPEAWLHLER